MKIILETPRLLLREMSLADLDFVAAMLGSPEVMRFYPQVYSRQDAEAWIRRGLARYAKDGVGLWLVMEKACGEPVGQVGLIRQLIEGVDEMEIGYLIHFPFWRRGYAGEAALAVREYAFTCLSRPHVISLIRPINRPSQAVARKIGMRPGKLTLYGGLEHIIFRVDRDEPTQSAFRRQGVTRADQGTLSGSILSCRSRSASRSARRRSSSARRRAALIWSYVLSCSSLVGSKPCSSQKRNQGRSWFRQRPCQTPSSTPSGSIGKRLW